MSVSLAIDPKTYDMTLDDDGQPVYTTDPTPELLLAIGIPVGSLFTDPEQGSRIPGFTTGEKIPTSTREVEQAASDALARLVDSGLITIEGIVYTPEDRELMINTAEMADSVTVDI